MIPDVRVRLLKAAVEFCKFLDVPGLVISDIVVTGSNASYNYTEGSDIDIHIVVDYKQTPCPSLAENFFKTKKNLWNNTHDMHIGVYPLELYVEDKNKPAFSAGEYSILNGKWLSVPERRKPRWDDKAVISKTEHLAHCLDELMTGDPSSAKIDRALDKLANMRKAGLARGGEFSTENLAFKSLRALGYMDRLRDLKNELLDAEISTN